jgi:hypothetical protein
MINAMHALPSLARLSALHVIEPSGHDPVVSAELNGAVDDAASALRSIDNRAER